MRILTAILFFVLSLPVFSQQQVIDSLLRQANNTKSDTIKLVLFRSISRIYAEIDPDSAFYYAEKSLQLARKLQFKLDEGSALREMGYALLNRGNLPRSLQTVLSALSVVENPKSDQKILIGKFPGEDGMFSRTEPPNLQRLSEIAFTYQILGVLYVNTNNYEKALVYHLKAREKAEEAGNLPLQSIINMTMGRVYLNLRKTDSALVSEQKAYAQIQQSGYKRYLGSALLNTGRVYLALGKKDSAMHFFRMAVLASKETHYYRGVAASNLALAEIYKQMGQPDSSLFYIRKALASAYELDAPDLFLRTYTALANYYKTAGNSDSTVKYQSLIIQINDSLFNVKQSQEFQNIDFDEQQRQLQMEADRKALRNKAMTWGLVGGLAVFLFIMIVLWRSSRQRQRANRLLSNQKSELENALKKLTDAQNQLIQSEKMASLGELTAGIAHEIQNPLNFVNNFSEVNSELIEEMRGELISGNNAEAIRIGEDVKQNNEKIAFHGKRADSIVKSMLQHSRNSSGQKEVTDINALVDECMRLSYHGMRAKDKTFNAKMETDLDPSVPRINIASQDIGRVLLNLFTNAFYSVTQKQKTEVSNYEPVVSARTIRTGEGVMIQVKDNGLGIPQKAMDKIFQPFFTTKPTGEGTGLGLSLSYDIITKGHGGQLKVNTKEGEYAEFIILLPG